MDYLDIQQKKFELENAKDKHNKAAKEFDFIQKETKDVFVSVVEKIALYSAGIISLTITFLGYLLNQQNKDILVKNFLYLPLYLYLYISWGLLAINLIISLIIKWIDALMIYCFGHYHWIESRREYEGKKLNLYKTNQMFIFPEGETKDTAIRVTDENISKLKGIEDESKGKDKSYYKIKKILQWIVFISFSIGIFLVVIFAIISTYRLMSS